MSSEKVIGFLNSLDENTSIGKEFEAAVAAGGSQAASAVDVAARHGLSFTEDDFTTVLDQMAHRGSQELSDSELDAVAGGMVSMPAPQAGKEFRNLRIDFSSKMILLRNKRV